MVFVTPRFATPRSFSVFVVYIFTHKFASLNIETPLHKTLHKTLLQFITMVKEIKVHSCGKQPYHSGLGDLRKRHMVNHNGTHKTLTLETTLQWDALGRMGQSFGLTEERTCQEKIDSIISVYIQFSDFDQACEVVLPLTESRASTWANGVNGRLLNLPHFSLNSEGLAPQIHKNVKTAYEFWRMKEICDKGLHWHKWETIAAVSPRVGFQRGN